MFSNKYGKSFDTWKKRKFTTAVDSKKLFTWKPERKEKREKKKGNFFGSLLLKRGKKRKK